MAVRSLISKPRPLCSLFSYLLNSKSYTLSSLAPRTKNLPSPDLVNEISRILSDHRNPHHDLELSLTTYSSHISTTLVEQVLKRCKNLGFSAQRFFLWAKRIPGFDHSKESYHILVDILGSSKQFALLWDFLIEIRESQDFEISPQVFWLVFRAYSRANLPSDAIRAFDRMVEFGLKPTIDDLDQLLYVLCKRKHAKHAQQIFDRVKHQFQTRAKTYSILVRGWGDIGESVSACKVFDEMREQQCAVDVLAYNSLLEAFCKGGKVSEAYKMFREMGSNGIKPDACTFSIFIRAYCEANDIHLAYRVLDEMKRYDLVPNVFTYNCMIKKLCKKEKVEEAYQLLNEIIERSGQPDAWSYNAILAYHCEHSEVNSATRLISRMVKDNCLPDKHSYNMLLKLLIRVGRFDRAIEVWESMGEKGFYPSVSTYSVMVHGLCKKKGKLEEACKYFEMMIDEGIPPYSSTVEILRNRLIGLGLLDYIEILAGKMEHSTACSIQELAIAMRGGKVHVRSRSEETESESD
ncbi:pentatricopeptide repeat-containing protein At1g52640, mitochondrial [Ricinus communis]|uniref:Pentatricopeptide repeat-containing protein, putative n=1 Tax=Ricinus communis TaxID=3988 RepID=B9SY25_RICCO|nr:pentatricopeptide repeat-containing protein At1g52640, mitochondrial [Ricinus communis]XP_015581918.1 pentatricopeptide repeat-containing protein At1g52640, mitochondrial [Ricinus communis]EEF31500.1 pentatricopeptide repeat-containing protein, putative [Ricinus communis]|eukprot:XP_002530894.1 pentatricopeptide repeat-containing protein At1g52640, mitochondrial [Ricinus communis]